MSEAPGAEAGPTDAPARDLAGALFVGSLGRRIRYDEHGRKLQRDQWHGALQQFAIGGVHTN